MAVQFNFRASTVTASLPVAMNFSSEGSSTIFASGPAAAPISDADNRVSFVVTGSAASGDLSATFLTIRTRHRFLFRPTERGRLTASVFPTPSFFFSLTCAGESWFDQAGPVQVSLFTRLDVRATAQNGLTVINFHSGWHNQFLRRLEGTAVASSFTGGFAPELMDIVETRSFLTEVGTTDEVRVDARYSLEVRAFDVSTFMIDAGADLGLNVPMAVIRTDP